jgi:hypothetical protein
VARKRFSFIIPPVEHEALKAMARANERSAGAEVRAALRRSLDEFYGHPERDRVAMFENENGAPEEAASRDRDAVDAAAGRAHGRY